MIDYLVCCLVVYLSGELLQSIRVNWYYYWLRLRDGGNYSRGFRLLNHRGDGLKGLGLLLLLKGTYGGLVSLLVVAGVMILVRD